MGALREGFVKKKRYLVTALAATLAFSVAPISSASSPNGSGELHVPTAAQAAALVAPAAGEFVPVTPARIADSRTGLGLPLAKLTAGSTTDFVVTGSGGVPSTGVLAVVLNLTTTGATANGYMTVWPAGQPRPGTSGINTHAGERTANAVTVKVGAGGKASVFNSAGSTDLVVDISGYYITDASATSGASFVPLEQERVLSTITGVGAPVGKIGAGVTLDVTLGGVAGIPSSGVSAVVMNVTAANPTADGSLKIWPKGTTVPTSTTMQPYAATNSSNQVTSALGTGGKVSILNGAGLIDLAVDVQGYYLAPVAGEDGARYVPLQGARVYRSNSPVTPPTAAPVTNGQFQTIQVAGLGGIPANTDKIAAVVVNIKALSPTGTGRLIAYSPGEDHTPPSITSLSYTDGVNTQNVVITTTSRAGEIDVYQIGTGTTNIAVDVVGYFEEPPGTTEQDLPFSGPNPDCELPLDERTSNWVCDEPPAGELQVQVPGDQSMPEFALTPDEFRDQVLAAEAEETEGAESSTLATKMASRAAGGYEKWRQCGKNDNQGTYVRYNDLLADFSGGVYFGTRNRYYGYINMYTDWEIEGAKVTSYPINAKFSTTVNDMIFSASVLNAAPGAMGDLISNSFSTKNVGVSPAGYLAQWKPKGYSAYHYKTWDKTVAMQWSWTSPALGSGYWYYWAKSPSMSTPDKGKKRDTYYKFRSGYSASLPAKPCDIGFRAS